MANDLENKVDDIKDVDEVEADDVDTDEDDELEGYQNTNSHCLIHQLR